METIFLLCEDEEYNLNIEAQLALQLGSNVILHIITDKQYLEQIISKPSEVSVIIAEPGFIPLIAAKIKAKAVFILDDRGVNLPQGHISKYAGAQAIIRVLDSRLLAQDGDISKRETQIIDVASVCGGCGKTLTALGIAKKLSLTGRKVLYVNVESLQDFYTFFQDKKDHMSDEMIRAMSYITNESLERIISGVAHDTFDFIPEIRQITTEIKIFDRTYYELVRQIAKRYLYDYIVVEHGINLSLEMLKWLSDSNRLVVVLSQDKTSVDRTERFIKGIQGFKGQCFLICGKYQKDKADALQGSELSDRYTVCEWIENQTQVSLDDLIKNKKFSSISEVLLY